MKIFVTGITGFVGKRIARLLLEKKYEVSGLVRNVEKAKKIFGGEVSFCESDICELDIKKDGNVLGADVICHFAACVDSEKTADFYNINCEGTRKLCAVLQNAKKLKSIIYLSSLAVVGKDSLGPITETTLCQPFSPYGKSKLEAEKILRAFQAQHPHVQLIILRVPVIYGEEQSSAVTSFFEKIQKKKIIVLGNGSNIRSMCYIKNLENSILWLIQNRNLLERICVLNISDKRQLDLRSLIQLIANKMRLDISIKCVPGVLSSAAIFFYKTMNYFGFNSLKLFMVATASARIECSIKKMQSLGIPLDYELEEGIEKTIQWLRTSKN